MKKILLSAMAVAAATFSGWADVYTFVLDGNNDLGGLTRQTSNKEANLTFSDTFTMTEEGVELTVKKGEGEGAGLALVNAGGNNAGLLLFGTFWKPITPEISLKVPGGKITSVKLNMSGLALLQLEIPFNGVEPGLEADGEGPIYYWLWKDATGMESVSCSWANNTERYIHSIEVSYTPDLGGKQACGLAFAEAEYEAILGEEFTSPALDNPNKLEVSWSSSNEAVATVDAQGKVTLAGKGTAIIKAQTKGNDEFAAGNAKYTLSVIPSAVNIADLLEEAPAQYDRVKVNFPMTVNFANLSFAYVTDAVGNATCIDNTSTRNNSSTTPITIYKVGDIIPAGWIATNMTINESAIWEGLPEKSTETAEVKYPFVTAVTPKDADRVVILENVTFTTRTAEGYEKAYGTTPDGTRYEFQDTYGTGAKDAGTYDVTCVVRYSKRGTTEYFYLAPIAYSAPGSGVNAIEEAGKAEYFDLNGNRIANPGKGLYIKVVDGKAELRVKS